MPTTEKEKKASSLRTYLLLTMVALLLLQSIALALALLLAGVPFALDTESFRQFTTSTTYQAEESSRKMAELARNTELELEVLKDKLYLLYQTNELASADMFENQDMYTEASLLAANTLVGLLLNNEINTAYVVFTGAPPGDTVGAHAAIVIQNNTPGQVGLDYSELVLEKGPAAVFRQFSIPPSQHWSEGVLLEEDAPPGHAFYTEPIEASAAAPGLPLQDYGYWDTGVDLDGDSIGQITYSLPLLDANGAAFAVLGVELSTDLFESNYIPSSNPNFTGSYYAVSTRGTTSDTLDGLIKGGPRARAGLQDVHEVPLRPVHGRDLYAADLPSEEAQYCAVLSLGLYHPSSPFAAEDWRLAAFVPQNQLHSNSRGILPKLVGAIVVFTLVSIVAVVALVTYATRRINRLPTEIKRVRPSREFTFSKTGYREIDELTGAIETLNRNVLYNEKLSARIMDLTNMPLGYFEVDNQKTNVNVTRYIYALLKLEEGTLITQKAWEIHYKFLTSRPAADLKDIYLYTEYNLSVDDEEGHTLWLRIRTSETEHGYVGTIQDITEDVLREKQLAEELDFDPLTKLFSRIAFKREAHARLATGADQIGMMIFSDLDNLKYINDTFGHDVGDKYIMKAGQLFARFSKDGGVVSRISGDEFAIYLHGFTSQDEARGKLFEVFGDMGSTYLSTPDGRRHPVRFSSGVAWYPEDSDNITDLLKLSDFAMYEAKHSSKGTIREFNRQSYNESAYLLENREAINRLIDEEMIRYAFQPIVNLKTGEVFGYEALMRPLLDNFKNPLEILSVAEAQSKLGQLEKMTLFKVFEAAHCQLHRIGGKLVFINSIPSQNIGDADLAVLHKRYPALFDQVVVELTEDKNYSLPMLRKKVASIRRMQLRLAIDDYGAGYSNEVRVLTLNPDIIKIDREIVTDIHREPDKQQLFSNIIGFCKTKGILTVAEGIETVEDLREVHRLGADLVQGFYTGRPGFDIAPIDLTVTELIKSLNKH